MESKLFFSDNLALNVLKRFEDLLFCEDPEVLSFFEPPETSYAYYSWAAFESDLGF